MWPPVVSTLVQGIDGVLMWLDPELATAELFEDDTKQRTLTIGGSITIFTLVQLVSLENEKNLGLSILSDCLL